MDDLTVGNLFTILIFILSIVGGMLYALIYL